MKKRIVIIALAVLLVASLLLCAVSCSNSKEEQTEETIAPMETAGMTEGAEEITEPTEGTEPNATEESKTQEGSSGAYPSGSTGSGNGQQTGNTGSGSSRPSGSTGSGGAAGTPAVTQPLVTESPATKPTEHIHSYTVSSTTPASCTSEGSTTYACSCGDSYTEAISMTAHNWVHHHEDEVGHTEGRCVCRCGARFSSTAEWIAHTKNYDAVEALTNHGGYASGSDYVIDVPARDWDECSICGATK